MQTREFLPSPAPLADAVERALVTLDRFMPHQQLAFVRTLFDGEEGDYFRQKMIDLATVVSTMPKSYDQDGMGDDTVISLHYFRGGADWWITERDEEPEQNQAFGLVNLGIGLPSELGYISLIELCEQGGVEMDFHWSPKTLAAVKAAG